VKKLQDLDAVLQRDEGHGKIHGSADDTLHQVRVEFIPEEVLGRGYSCILKRPPPEGVDRLGAERLDPVRNVEAPVRGEAL